MDLPELPVELQGKIELYKQVTARLQTAGSFCCLPVSFLNLNNAQKTEVGFPSEFKTLAHSQWLLLLMYAWVKTKGVLAFFFSEMAVAQHNSSLG